MVGPPLVSAGICEYKSQLDLEGGFEETLVSVILCEDVQLYRFGTLPTGPKCIKLASVGISTLFKLKLATILLISNLYPLSSRYQRLFNKSSQVWPSL